ncbi:MAG: YHS domain-containing protein [Candidatus Omnitrophica bacterium]|nr:YHS domain-containing protein [Candidatus Omnitrophota bacterium]MBU0896541.1 YHS domain-containing protein [Candidatus Omnitrophota bacterium]MBU1367478.1 YHS domain-containing protein [Candidatus Omnitrophota bacterium]MBU1523629.1 YHS domain-containing protein [Candidatus Omnitrophota bacterium]MBU1810255.1 YHS domain-containing protein [Candidatus Omnitrophota bacterium]
MSRRLFVVGLSICLVGIASLGLAQEEHKHHQTMAEAGSYKEFSSGGAVEVGNKICPVSGEDIESMGGGSKYEYEGKIYNFCCPMCVEKFKKDPQKYIKIIEENMKKEITDIFGSKMSPEEGSHGHSGHSH